MMLFKIVIKIKIVVLFLFCFTTMQAQEFIPLWPKGKMPNTKGMKLEHIEERERITQVGSTRNVCFFYF